MQDAVEMLSQRLEAVERANRTLRRAMVVVLGGAGLLGALALARPVVARDAQELECTKLRLMDSKGKCRGVLACGKDDSPVFALLDEEQKPRVVINLDASGASSMGLVDKDEQPRATIALTDSGPALTLKRQDNGSSISLASAKGETGLLIQDGKGKTRLGAFLEKGSIPIFIVKDGNEKARAYMGADADGKAEMKILDESGADLWKKP